MSMPRKAPANYRTRLVVAFCIAPLLVPVSVFISFLTSPDDLIWPLTIALVAAILAFGGTILFGIPLYWFLRARGWLLFWVVALCGFIGGTIAWYVFSVFANFDAGLFPVRPFWIWPGIWGAGVGATMWLIARPDRNEDTGIRA